MWRIAGHQLLVARQQLLGDARAQISLGPGGQGANVAVRLARAGVPVRLITPLADDPAGHVLRANLEGQSVDLVSLPASRTSMVVVLLDPAGERTMLSDRVPASGEVATAIRGCDWVHVSGYLLRDPEEAHAVVSALRTAGIEQISIAGGSFQARADAGVARDAAAAMGAKLLIVNREEAGLLAGEPMSAADEAASLLATGERLAVVTDGTRGSAAAGLAKTRAVLQGASAAGRPSVDATGAGDAFTASLLASLAPQWPPAADLVATALERAALAGAAATTAVGAQSPTARDAPDAGA